MLALACATTSAFSPSLDRVGAPRCTFSPGDIIDPSGQAQQRVHAAAGGGVLSTDEECAERAKVVHPAATGATFTVAGSVGDAGAWPQ